MADHPNTGAQGTKFELLQVCVRLVFTKQLQQQSCQQRAVNYQSGIALLRGYVVTVIVNTGGR